MNGYLSKIRQFFYICCFMQIVPLLQAAPWEPPVVVSVPGESIRVDGGAVLDVNASNNGVAVWCREIEFFDSSVIDVQASFYTFGSGWSNPEIISSTELRPSSNVRIFTNQADSQVSLNEVNYSVAVWEASEYIIEAGFDIRGVYSAARSPAGIWTPVQRISALNTTDPAFLPDNPRCAVNDAGLAVAVWIEERTDLTVNKYVMASFLPMGGSWTTPTQISDPFSQFSYSEWTPDVAINNKGDVAVVWKEDVLGTGIYTTFAANYDGTTNAWSLPFTLDTTGVNNDFIDIPKVAIDPNGNAVAVWGWQDSNIFTSRIYAASFTPGSGWGSSLIVDETTIPSASLNLANVVIDRFGNSTIVWEYRNFLTNDDVFSSRLPLGGVWTAPVKISTNTIINENSYLNIGSVQRPISVDLNGNVIVIYESFVNDITTLKSVTNLVNLGWQAPEFISSDVAYPLQFIPHFENIGFGSCGFALSLWQAGNNPNINLILDQVWSSVNLGITPFPPCDFTGSRCQERFVTQSINIDQLTWKSCDSTCVLFYKLYRNGQLIATFPVGAATFFKDAVGSKKEVTIYTLTAVSVNGVEGPPAILVLP